MSEIKQLRDDQLDKIFAFWESTNQEDAMCNVFYGICAAACEGHVVLTQAEYDTLYRLKYKYGMRILRRIAIRAKPHNADVTGLAPAQEGKS